MRAIDEVIEIFAWANQYTLLGQPLGDIFLVAAAILIILVNIDFFFRRPKRRQKAEQARKVPGKEFDDGFSESPGLEGSPALLDESKVIKRRRHQ